ncbi:hypothetical protein [Horticoccus sp. 23ND18S-11]|uniref:hypothetical protein n=1 Tax=Horticoccus sp. 23ND18S-11 TaxID=3391832 RepID=UPI0039C9B766
MQRFRLPLIAFGALVVALVVIVAVAFTSSFQTWAARRFIAGQPGLRATVGQVSAGLSRVEVTEARYELTEGVLTIPRLAVELPVFAAGWNKKVQISRLVAKGWTLDLSAPRPPAAPALTPAVGPQPPAPTDGTPSAVPVAPPASSTASPASVAAQAFAGIFTRLDLPVDLSVESVLLEGEVKLPEGRGTVRVTVQGGGLGVGREGRFDLTADAALRDPAVETLTVQGRLAAAMATPRTFNRVSAQLNASARGPQFPAGVSLRGTSAAARTDTGETYSVAFVSDDRELVNVTADFPRQGAKLTGRWKLDARTADVSPFTLGQPLPEFFAVGEGAFDTDPRFESLHALGQLRCTADRLQVFRPELAALGELGLAAEFDVAAHGGTFAVRKLELAVSALEKNAAAERLANARVPGSGRLVATVRTLQPFDFTPGTGELNAANRTIDLVGVVLHGVPLAWVKPLLPEFELSGGHLRGELAATARGGGVTLHSTVPLTVDGVALAQAGKPLLRAIDLSLAMTADYTPQGWQAELSNVTVTSGGASLLSLSAKTGQLAGKDRSVKAAGRARVNLPAALAQPALAGKATLASGDAAIDFVVSLGEKKELQATVALTQLTTPAPAGAVRLPALSSNIRADLAADGRIAINAPIVLDHEDRKSDLNLIGTIDPEKNKSRAIEAEVTSAYLVMGDARLLGALLPSAATPVPPVAPAAAPTPAPVIAAPWSGLHGTIALRLKQVIYSDTLSASNVTGRLRLDAGMIKLEGLQAGLGESGRAHVSGSVAFEASTSPTYTLAADVAVKEFDPAPLFRASGTDAAATVEGKFDVTSRVSAVSPTLGGLADGAGGSFQLTSKGGVFRGLPVNVSTIADTTSKFAALIASAGTAISAMTGKRDYADVANRAEAVAELVRGLNPIRFDQLSVVLARDEACNTTLRDFTLISPEVRLSGAGVAVHRQGTALLDDALTMEFTLRARGRQGDLLKYLGAIEAQTDDLGYATCTVPLKVGGTVARPETSELNLKLTALAIEKSGLSEFATELLNRIRGGK